MSKKQTHISTLKSYLPEGTFEPVLQYLQQFAVHLTIARERKSILGDYRHKTYGKNHRISVNGNLNSFAFLITLLHELAHLLTFEKYGHTVSAHGREWKTIFGQLLAQFLQHNVFPPDIHNSLLSSLHNPAASSCSDENLLRVLRRYDAKKDGWVFVENVPMGHLFKTPDGRVFKRGEKMRKRYRCTEEGTRRLYLFSAVYEVKWLKPEAGAA